MKQSITVSLLFATLLLGGCIFAPDGGSGRDYGGRVRPTIGQELLDLDRAYDAGIISSNEYERTKERILNSRN